MPTITKHITILPGECFTLPKGAIVKAISDELTNSCSFDLPTPTALECYQFSWEITDNVGGQSQAWDHENNNNKFVKITFDGVDYPISLDTSDPGALAGTINNLLLSKGVTVISNSRTQIGVTDIDLCIVQFKAFPTVVSTFNISVQLAGGANSIKLHPVSITCP
jgi:hypothetical protein